VALYTKDSVEALKEALDIVEVVSARTDLRRVGQRHTGLCPFHDERTPSFSVSADLGLYHCFGCGESGDAIRFVQHMEGLDFRQAIELLARTEALFLDPTYTAKAMAGLIARVRAGEFRDDQTVLFWHTGGQVGLFA